MLNRNSLVGIVGLIGAGLTACSSVESIKQSINPQPTLEPARPKAVVPQEFLLSNYAPLNAWLDSSVRVQIIEVPLSRVFQESSLAGLNHNLTNMPADEEEKLISIDELAMTRRQLLWAISQDYRLTMTPKFDSFGGTAYIDIRGK